MSSDGDILAFSNSVEDNLESTQTMLFNQKKWTYITDSTSNSGTFGSGQIQFDLSSLSSQSQWLSLNEAVVEFPVKIVATTAGVAGGIVTGGIHSTIIKNGWHQWISSAQLMINGQTLQTAQPYENVATQWRILSSWSQDELVKQGPSCGFALDDMTGNSESSVLASDGGLANATAATFLSETKGFDCLNTIANVPSTLLVNKGAIDRAQMTNNSVAGTTLQATVLSAVNMKIAGRSNVARTASAAGAAGTVFSAFYMATVRLKDICDLREFPLTKNLRGYLYLNFNAATINFTGNSGGVTALAMQINSGQTCPFLINSVASGTVGLLSSNHANPITVVGNVDGSNTSAISPSGPLLTSARLVVPYYVANPMADAALSQTNKFFTTLDKFFFSFDVEPLAPVNYTITSGVSNPRRIVMLPLLKKLGGMTTMSTPEQSPFDPAPATSGPFATMNNLQVMVANQTVYQSPIQYDYEQFLQEQSQVGESGNMSNENTSGLLSEQLWIQNHRFYTVDIGRRVDAEDGSSKSVQINYTNANTYGQRVIGHLYAEKRWVMDTTTCTLSPL
jgi:hypothetical protein